MPIFTCQFSIDISKRVFDLFFLEQSAERCLLRVILKCFSRMEDRCLKMEEDAMMDFITKGVFIERCFAEYTLADLFLDE
jgi:hypothetical protein